MEHVAPNFLTILDPFSPSAVQANVYTLFNDENSTDITFVVGNNEIGKETFKCHRVLFACQSPVFKSMLCGKMRESKERTIVINDISPDCFRSMKEAFYGGNPVISAMNVVELLYASEKYIIDYLKNACLKYIKQNCLRHGNSIQLEYGIDSVTLLLTIISQMRDKKMLNIMGSILQFNNFVFDKNQCIQLLYSDEFLSFDSKSVLFLVFESKLLNKEYVSMENKWILIDRWCKYQVFEKIYKMNKFDERFELKVTQDFVNYYSYIQVFLSHFDYKSMSSQFLVSKIFPLYEKIHSLGQRGKNILNNTKEMESLLWHYYGIENECDNDSNSKMIGNIECFECFSVESINVIEQKEIETFGCEIIRFDINMTCRDIYNQLCEKDSRGQVLVGLKKIPRIHIWARLGSVKHLIYQTKQSEEAKIVIDEKDLTQSKIGDLTKWVEIPFDFLASMQLCQFKFDANNDLNKQLCFEYGHIADQENGIIKWPLSLSMQGGFDNLLQCVEALRVGLMIDVLDMSGFWYESVICKIDYDKTRLIMGIAVHYVGWTHKYDEWIQLPSDLNRIAKRGTYSKGPHIKVPRAHGARSRRALAFPSSFLLNNYGAVGGHAPDTPSSSPDILGIAFNMD